MVLTNTARDTFFRDVLQKSGLGLDVLAIRYRISPRTFRDWRRGKFLPALEVMEGLARDFHISLPQFRTREQYWYALKSAKKAAMIRMALYGPPGTPDGRKKGGLISQQRRRERPDFYRELGCNIPKECPSLRHSKELAELCGIILGDGSLTKDQLRISLDRAADKKYVPFVSDLMEKIFHEKPKIFFRQSTAELYISGIKLLDGLEKIGLRRGSKVTHQVGIPPWIMQKNLFAQSCLRGLFDTDGGIYMHKHKNITRKWTNLGWCFTNHSLPLVEGCRKILKDCDIEPKGNAKEKVYLYSVGNIRRFMKIIGSSNPKNVDRYNTYMKHFYTYEWKRKGAGAV